MDLTKLSDADLMALQSGDLSKVSDAGLALLSATKEDKATRAAKNLEEDRAKYAPTVGMSGTDKFFAGMGKAGYDIARGVRQYLPQGMGGLSNEQIQESRNLDAPLMNTGAGMAGNITGNVVAAAPAAFIPGAATIPGSAAVGAAYGALQPGTSAGERFKNVAIGAGAGAAVPIAVRGAQVAKSFIDPLYEGGRNAIMGRTLRTASGGNADEVVRNLRGAQELVPGSLPTAAEAANNPGIAALQRTATAADPVALNQVAARQAANNDARIAALRNLAGDKTAKEAALQARQGAAEVAYSRARNSDLMRRELSIQDQIAKDAQFAGLGSLGNAPVRTEAQSAAMAIRPTKALEDLAKRPSFAGFINDAKRMAADKGVDIGNPLTSIDGLHYLKLAIDDALEPTATNALGRNAKSALMDMKTTLTKEMDAISPVYGASREAYQQASRPINQMAVGEELMGAVNPLTGKIMPSQFARKLSDETAQTATGFKGATLENTLEPAQLQSMNALKDDLARANFAETAGRGVGSDTVQKMAFSNMMQQSGLPAMVTNFAPLGVVGNLAQKAGQVVYRDANERMAAQLAQSLLDPREAARLMEAGMVTPQMQALVQGLRRGGAAIGSSVPGLIQANQE
jgi:hypothetical protein